MLGVILIISKFLGTALTGILGIVGINSETTQEVPGEKSTKKVLTPAGRRIRFWTILSLGVAVVAQICEEVVSHQAEQEAAITATNMLHSTTQSLAHVTRMVNRFQTLTVEAEYAVPLTTNGLSLIAGWLKDNKPLPRCASWVTNQAVRELSLQFDALTNHLTGNKPAFAHLAPLADAELAIDIFDSTNGTNPLFSTFGCEHHRSVELACPANRGELIIRWKVFFPSALWYQTRQLITDSDLAGKVLQIGLAEKAGADFANLHPLRLNVIMDGEAIELNKFDRVQALTTELRTERATEMINKPARNGSRPAKVPVIKTYTVSTNVPGRRDPARGKLVAIHQATVPPDRSTAE